MTPPASGGHLLFRCPPVDLIRGAIQPYSPSARSYSPVGGCAREFLHPETHAAVRGPQGYGALRSDLAACQAGRSTPSQHVSELRFRICCPNSVPAGCGNCLDAGPSAVPWISCGCAVERTSNCSRRYLAAMRCRVQIGSLLWAPSASYRCFSEKSSTNDPSGLPRRTRRKP